MILYRDHKGSLSESMKTVREVKNLAEIKEHIKQSWGMGIEEIRVEPYAFDDRIGWETHIVMCYFEGDLKIPVGFTNGYLG